VIIGERKHSYSASSFFFFCKALAEDEKGEKKKRGNWIIHLFRYLKKKPTLLVLSVKVIQRILLV
jgi:hypothetical protein